MSLHFFVPLEILYDNLGKNELAYSFSDFSKLFFGIKDRHQISLLTLNESEQIKQYFPLNRQKIVSFLMISGGTEVN